MITEKTKKRLAKWSMTNGYVKGPGYYKVPDYDRAIKVLLDRFNSGWKD